MVVIIVLLRIFKGLFNCSFVSLGYCRFSLFVSVMSTTRLFVVGIHDYVKIVYSLNNFLLALPHGWLRPAVGLLRTRLQWTLRVLWVGTTNWWEGYIVRGYCHPCADAWTQGLVSLVRRRLRRRCWQNTRNIRPILDRSYVDLYFNPSIFYNTNYSFRIRIRKEEEAQVWHLNST